MNLIPDELLVSAGATKKHKIVIELYINVQCRFFHEQHIDIGHHLQAQFIIVTSFLIFFVFFWINITFSVARGLKIPKNLNSKWQAEGQIDGQTYMDGFCQDIK